MALNCKLQMMFKMNVFVNRYIRNIVRNVFLRYCRLLLLSYRINLLKSCSVRQGLEPSMFKVFINFHSCLEEFFLP